MKKWFTIAVLAVIVIWWMAAAPRADIPIAASVKLDPATAEAIKAVDRSADFAAVLRHFPPALPGFDDLAPVAGSVGGRREGHAHASIRVDEEVELRQVRIPEGATIARRAFGEQGQGTLQDYSRVGPVRIPGDRAKAPSLAPSRDDPGSRAEPHAAF